MSTPTTSTIDPTARRVPPLGGLNTTVLGIELRRMLRNRRTIIFTLIFPAALLLSFGGQSGWDDKAGLGNVAAYILVSMGLYGAALTAAAGGSMVALELRAADTLRHLEHHRRFWAHLLERVRAYFYYGKKIRA